MNLIKKTTIKKFNTDMISDKVLDIDYDNTRTKVVVTDIFSEENIQVMDLKTGDVFILSASQVTKMEIDKKTSEMIDKIFENIGHFGYKEY